jgi:hypothetical protein
MDSERRRDIVTWMAEHMAKTDMFAKDVGKRLGHNTNSFVSQVLRRDKKIPQDAADKWARAFRLTDDRDVDHFRLLVMLMWSAEPIVRDYWAFRDRLAALENRTDSHIDQVAAQAERIKALEAQLALAREEKAALLKRRG